MNAFPELLLALFLLAPLFFQAEKLIIWQQTFDYLFMAQVIYYTHANTFALFYKTIHLLLYRCIFCRIVVVGVGIVYTKIINYSTWLFEELVVTDLPKRSLSF